MNTALWIVQALLALAFLMAGGMKVAQTRSKLMEMGMEYVEDFTDAQVKGIGVVELLGAVGLILPMALDILPVLTPLAAVGLALTMVGAAYTHYRRDEVPKIAPNVVLFALAVFAAYGRFVIEPVV